jgi:hypothetical protein
MERSNVNAAWAAIVVATISGPLMWVLYRLDKRNTSQHGEAVKIIQEVKLKVSDVQDDVKDVKGDIRILKSDVRDLQKPKSKKSANVDI